MLSIPRALEAQHTYDCLVPAKDSRSLREILLAVGIVALASGCTVLPPPHVTPLPPASPASRSAANRSAFSAATSSAHADLAYPIARARERVTKKPFGIHVSPSSSPVSPERFSGYHTGVDFETFQDEQDVDVPITAACAGTVRFAGWVKGYGGVVIQQCTYETQPVTVLYGHLNIASVSLRAGSDVGSGEGIGVLGKGYSTQTDGERKHLHFSIHKGAALEYRGYVPTAAQLDGWINPFPF